MKVPESVACLETVAFATLLQSIRRLARLSSMHYGALAPKLRKPHGLAMQDFLCCDCSAWSRAIGSISDQIDFRIVDFVQGRLSAKDQTFFSASQAGGLQEITSRLRATNMIGFKKTSDFIYFVPVAGFAGGIIPVYFFLLLVRR